MKSSLRFLAFALGAGLAFAAPTAAQAQVSVGINIGGLPPWGPPVQQGTQYYYIPEIDGYYDIYTGSYIVFDGQQWISVPYLDGYDPYYFHPVPVAYVGAQPWLNIGAYRRRYPQYVTVYRGGGYGNAGRYNGHEYGAGRVYGYDRGNYYNNRPGYGGNYGGGNYGGNRGGNDRRDDNDRRGGYPDNHGGNYGGRDQRGYNQPQGGGQPGNRGGQPNFGRPSQPNFGQGQGPQPSGQNPSQPGGPGRGGQGQPGGDRGQGGGPGRGGDRGPGRR